MSAQVFELKFPFSYRDTEYKSLTARRPKVRDLRQFMKDVDKDAVSALEKVLGNLCDVDDKVIAEVDVEDFTPIRNWFMGFLKNMLDESTES